MPCSRKPHGLPKSERPAANLKCKASSGDPFPQIDQRSEEFEKVIKSVSRVIDAMPLLAQPHFRRQAFASAERAARRSLPLGIRRLISHGTAFECPVCESRVSRFRDFGNCKNAWCPVCGSMPWHRLAWLFFQNKTSLFDGSPKRLLHIAPEPELAKRVLAVKGLDYLPVDLDPRRPYVKERMDITEIEYPDHSFDGILCSHVLEHVPDDRKAMREFQRVLKPGGWALIMVPLQLNPTVEDPTCTDPRERERRFGQFDHVRIYGPDLADRLSEAGFSVSQFSGRDLLSSDAEAHRMKMWSKAFHCSK